MGPLGSDNFPTGAASVWAHSQVEEQVVVDLLLACAPGTRKILSAWLEAKKSHQEDKGREGTINILQKMGTYFMSFQSHHIADLTASKMNLDEQDAPNIDADGVTSWYQRLRHSVKCAMRPFKKEDMQKHWITLKQQRYWCYKAVTGQKKDTLVAPMPCSNHCNFEDYKDFQGEGKREQNQSSGRGTRSLMYNRRDEKDKDNNFKSTQRHPNEKQRTAATTYFWVCCSHSRTEP